jgi:hypothetical protein
MIVEKIINRKVSLHNTKKIYSPDIHAVILSELQNIFVGKCYDQCRVTEIVEIIQISDICISEIQLNVSACCSVMFKVKGVVIEKGQLVNNCIVKPIHKNGSISCKNDKDMIFIKESKATQIYKEGQIIPAIAGGAKYNLFKPSISINAYPFIPIKNDEDNVIFKLKVQHDSITDTFLADLDSEIKKNKLISKYPYEFFTKLYYPRSSVHKPPQGSKLMDIRKIKEFKDGSEIIVSLPDWIRKNTNSILVYSEVKKVRNPLNTKEIQDMNGSLYIVEDYKNIMQSMIHKIIKYHINIRELCATYNTKEKINEYKSIWKMYESYRF